MRDIKIPAGIVSAVSTNTIVRFERGEELKARTLADLKAALESAGVVFLDGEY